MGGEQSRAAEKLKRALISASSLQVLDPNKPIVAKTDASKHAVGVASQREGVPVAPESRKAGGGRNLCPGIKVNCAPLYML